MIDIIDTMDIMGSTKNPEEFECKTKELEKEVRNILGDIAKLVNIYIEVEQFCMEYRFRQIGITVDSSSKMSKAEIIELIDIKDRLEKFGIYTRLLMY